MREYKMARRIIEHPATKFKCPECGKPMTHSPHESNIKFIEYISVECNACKIVTTKTIFNPE